MGQPAPQVRPAPAARRVLFEGAAVSVAEFRCTAEVTPAGPEEPNSTHSIVLVRRGGFRKIGRDGAVLADPNNVLFLNASQPYRYAHPVPGGDHCTVLAVEGEPARDLVARHAARAARHGDGPFELGHGPCSPRAAQLHFELLGLLRNAAPSIAIEDTAAELAAEAVRAAYTARGTAAARRPLTARSRRSGEEMVDAVKVALSAHPNSRPRLGDLARELGCSPFHLSRTFRATAGLTLREYAARLRARLAADRLASGVGGLTDLALDLGYADHSHFTNSFRRAWGVAPSRFRSVLGLRPV